MDHNFQGIKNRFNTCFINSVLQALLATPFLDEILLRSQNPSHLSNLLSKIFECRKIKKINSFEAVFQKIFDLLKVRNVLNKTLL